MIDLSNLSRISDLVGEFSTQQINQHLRGLYTSTQDALSTQTRDTVSTQTNIRINLHPSNNTLLDSIGVNDEEPQSINTPPPSYDSASCLPTYGEACLLISSEERLENQFHIISNPLCENTTKLYVHIPNSGMTENTVSSTTNYNIEDTFINSPVSQNSEPSQQIGDSLSTEMLYVNIPTSTIHENTSTSASNNSIPNTSIEYISRIYTTIKQTWIQPVINTSRILIQDTNKSLRKRLHRLPIIEQISNRIEILRTNRKTICAYCLCYISILLLLICACYLVYRSPGLAFLYFLMFIVIAFCSIV